MNRPAVSARRRNSLNLLRLILAALVIWPHTMAIAGMQEPQIAGRSPATWAVAGFFTLSGYLIYGSRRKLDLVTFFRHRFARIYPGYWVCLILTALAALFALGRWAVPGGPMEAVTYVLSNASLVQVQPDIANATAASGYPGVLNSSLWTLPHEMACYIVASIIGGPLLARRGVPVIGGLLVASLGLLIVLPRLFETPPMALRQFLSLLLFFLGGALLKALDRPSLFAPILLPVHAVVIVVLTLVNSRFGPEIAGLSIAALLLGLGNVVPSPRWVQVNDLSYGVYIYGFPVATVLYLATPLHDSFPALLVAVYLVTATLATLSWFLVENPTLTWARRETQPKPARAAT